MVRPSENGHDAAGTPLSHDGVHCHRPFSLPIYVSRKYALESKLSPLVQMHELGTISFMASEQTSLGVVELVRSLCPDASDEELREAEQSLTEYVAAVLRIFDRIDREREGDSRDDADRSRIRVA